MKRLIIAIIAVIVLFAGCDMGESGPVEITYSVAVGEAFAPFKYIEYTDSDGSVVTVGRTL
jgi:nitrous oxide reductase accessory protein NosL